MDMNKVKELRSRTNAPVSLIKSALAAYDDNVEAAETFIKSSWVPPDKDVNFKYIYAHVHSGRIGVMFEVGCGTDFVAKTEGFQALCKEISFQLVAGLPGPLEEQEWVRDSSRTIGDLIKALAGQTGEPIKILRYERWTV